MLIIDTVAAYLAIIAPSAITIIAALTSLLVAIAKFVAVVKENRGLKDEIVSIARSQDSKLDAVLKENETLKQNHAELMAAITRLRNKNPEAFKGKDGE
jgi:hypothetical protein